jgi:hypothetical protein
MLKLALPALAGLAAAVSVAAPAAAQNTLIIYGNDRCPEGQICVRAAESERYRIPQGLRSGPLAPKDQPWAKRASSVANAGAASGTGSCTATGAGGWTGCWSRMMREGQAESAQQSATQANSPEPR